MRRFKRVINTGDKFTRLTVIKLYKKIVGKKYAKCKCECGSIKKVLVSSLISGNTKSCGCLCIEKRYFNNRIHGMRSSRVYRIWSGMKSRCNIPSASGYKYYGARGIKVQKEWKKFEDFYADMGDPPTNRHELDRIDNEGNYTKNNCRWVTEIQQGRNRRSNKNINIDGVKMTLSEACEKFGADYRRTLDRLNLGWNPLKAIKTKKCEYGDRFSSKFKDAYKKRREID